MHSFLKAVVVFAVVGGVRSVEVKRYAPAITPGPGTEDVAKRQDLDACVIPAPLLYTRAIANRLVGFHWGLSS